MIELKDIENDSENKYTVVMKCADCKMVMQSTPPMTGVELSKAWIRIVASAPLANIRCPEGCTPTDHDYNAHHILVIEKSDDKNGR